jgi:hypothetical protein
MYKPGINNLNKTTELITEFGGYNRNFKIPENCFFDEENITSDYLPVISPRNKRAIFNVSGERLHGLFSKTSVGYINDGTLFYNGEAVSGLSFSDIEKERHFVSMGAKLLIFPDKVYINTNNLSDFGNLEAEFITAEGSEVVFGLCKSDGSLYENYHIGNTPPENPNNNDLWLDKSVIPNELKQFSEYSGNWISIATTYIRITYPNIGKSFKKYDGVIISACKNVELNNSFVLEDCGDDYVIISGILAESFSQTTPLRIERKIPDMDFYCENGNRVWGCSSKTNEIYSCKLGDPTNWYCYMGIASDSFAVSVGSDGDFTGAISYKGYVLFFKENCVHKIYGSNPPFTVNTSYIRGVQKGSEKSLVKVNETLYYKSPNGIVMYDGGLPISVSEVFSNDYYFNAVAGNLKNKYYVCMTNKNNKRILFTYDELNGVWHREDEINITEFICHNCNLYFIAEINKNKYLFLADATNKYGNFSGNLSGYNLEDDFSWSFETGLWGLDLPEKKYYSNINIRAIAQENSDLSIYFQYNSNNNWIKKAEFKIEKTGTLNIPFISPRCDNLKIKFEGKGDIKILSVSRKIEKGSEK